MSPARGVLILVGTDHHPFERAVSWADARQRAHPEESVVIQHGQTSAPSVATGHAFLPREQMHELIAAATVVVTHGGPGTINDVRAGGHRPIVLARNPAHGEHVDDHQMRFAAWCGQRGLVRLVTDLDQLDAVVAELGEGGTRESAADQEVPVGVAVVEALAMAPRPIARPARVVLPGSPVVLAIGPEDGLADALLEVPGAIVLGPAGGLPERLADDAATCACGRRVGACPVWSRVRAEAGDLGDLPGAPSLSTVVRRHLPRAVRTGLAERAGAVRRVVALAVAVTGARVVVDTGDLAGTLTLAHDAGLDLRVVVPPGRGAAGALTTAASRWRGLPVLSLSGRPSAATVAGRLASLPLPPVAPARVEHGPDLRLR